MTTSPIVRHGLDSDAGLEYLVTDWADGLPLQIIHRPIGADGWTQWSAPVELAEVQDMRMPEARR